MRCEIFIVSCAKHFDWLEYCLKSISKFASGFSGVTLLVPEDQRPLALERGFEKDCGLTCCLPLCGPEWPDKGMLWHMAQVMNADEWCPQADFILHTDSDCVFSEPVTPEDYFVNGKPVLMHASFEWLAKQQANLMMWKVAAEKALGWRVTEEIMRRHPAVHYRKVYAKTRECIERHTKMSCDDFIRSGENRFPQSVAEFPTLGAVAWKHFHGDYAWRNQETQGFPPSKLVQFWGHQTPEIPQEPIYMGKPFRCTPKHLLEIL